MAHPALSSGTALPALIQNKYVGLQWSERTSQLCNWSYGHQLGPVRGDHPLPGGSPRGG